MWGEVFSFLLPLYPKSATITRFLCPYQGFIMNLQANICVHDCFPLFLYKGYHTSHSVLGFLFLFLFYNVLVYFRLSVTPVCRECCYLFLGCLSSIVYILSY